MNSMFADFVWGLYNNHFFLKKNQNVAMNFKNQGRPLSRAGMERICTALGVEQAEVWTAMSVESKVFGFLSDHRQ